MTVELIVEIENRRGQLAAAAGLIGKANVNIRAFAAVAAGKLDEVRFITDDPERAERALKAGGYKVMRREVLTVPASNTPGELAALSERLASSGINIEGGYLASSPDGEHVEMVFEVADIKAANKLAR